MIKEKISKRKAVILFKPSGTIAIGGELTTIQRKFYDGFLYVGKKQLEENINRKWFEVKLKDLKSLLNANEQDKNNQYFKDQIRKLSQVEVEYNLLEKDKIIEGFFNLITEGKFITDKETGEVVIKYNLPNMVKESLLKNNKQALFAQINLAIKKNLKHKYSLILYDLIKDYESVDIPEITIKQFRKIFGIENKYKSFNDLKKRVINPAVTEINNNPDIEFKISVSLKKQGSKYTHIKFVKKKKPIIKQIEQKQLEIKENAKIEVILALIPEEHRTKGLKRFLSEAIEKYNIGYIEAQIKLVNKRNPDDYIAYLKSAIKEDYAGYYEIEDKKEEYREKIEQYLKKAQKIIETKNIDKEVKELAKELIYFEFNREKITEEEKENLLEVLENYE